MLAFSIVLLAIQLSLIKKISHLTAILFALFVLAYSIYTEAIEQSYSSLGYFLSNVGFLTNLAVVQSAESILGILLTIFLIRKEMGERVKKWIGYLIYFPGIIWFIALFIAESYMFLEIRAESFARLAFFIALSFGILIMILVSGFRWLIHEFDLRCEIKFLLHIVQIVIASALYISVNGLPVNNLPDYGSLPGLGLIALIFFTLMVIGYFAYKIKMNKIVSC